MWNKSSNSVRLNIEKNGHNHQNDNNKIVEIKTKRNNQLTDNIITVSKIISTSSTSTSSSSSYKNTIEQQFPSSTSLTNNTYECCLICNEYDQFQKYDDKRICLCELNNPSTNFIDYNNFYHHKNSTRSMIFDNPGQIYNYINRCRRWVKVFETDNYELRRNQFSLTTYNILAQNLLLNHLYLYRDQNKSDLEWLERSNRLKQELLELNSDIFCLQEVHFENFTTSILPSLKERGYQEISKFKTGQNYDGCTILFKKNKFKLQDSLEIQMNRLDISHLLDRDQVALVVKLRPIGRFHTNNDTNLIVANTHLIFNPRRGDVKLAQLRLLLAEIQRFAIRTTNRQSKLDYFPIILCGDFNSEPNSPLIKFVENGQYNFRDLRTGDISGQKDGTDKGQILQKNDIIMNGIDFNTCFTKNLSNENIPESNDDDLFVRHVLNFRSVYPTKDQFNLNFISTSTHLDCGLVDHLFYSKNHKNLHLSAFKQLMNKQNFKKIGNIPNSILGSDHIALSAKFYLT